MRIDPDWPEGIKRAMRAFRDKDVPAIMAGNVPPAFKAQPHKAMVAPASLYDVLWEKTE